MPLEIVEGYTGALDFDFFANGVRDASSGDTLALVLKTRDGHSISTSGNVSLQSSTSSGGPTIYFGRYVPDAGDLQAKWSPYGARFQVTRAGQTLYYPSSASPDSWVVGVP